MSYMVLKRIDPISFAKIYAAVMALIAFVCCLFYALFIMSFAGMMGGDAGAIGVGVAIAVVIFGPIACAVMYFLVGLLVAWLYNLVAARIGGVEFEFEEYE